MIRTRDFFLFLVVVGFLLIAIGTTLLSKQQPVETSRTLTFVDGEPTVTVTVDEPVLDRETNRRLYRDKIAAGATLYIQEDFYEADQIDNPDDAGEVALAQRCAGYRVYQGQLLSNTNPLTVVEGARVIYDAEASESAAAGTPATREVLLALPLSGVATGNQSCLPTDVVGVTLGGSVIKNDQIARYASFSEDTLIGYALDGFPIYGLSGAELDACGGVTVAEGYRYQINVSGSTILNCFSGIPGNIK